MTFVSIALRIFGALSALGGGFLAFTGFPAAEDVVPGLAGLVVGALLFGFGAVIDLLVQIRDRLPAPSPGETPEWADTIPVYRQGKAD